MTSNARGGRENDDGDEDDDDRKKPAWTITGPLSLLLRGTGEGVGRHVIYTIGVTCTDAAGNAATASTTVTPPRDVDEKGDAGAFHTCGAGQVLFGGQGNLECWGDNAFGQAPLTGGPVFAQLSAGGWHTCGISVNRSPLANFPPVLSCWGNNFYGQAGGIRAPRLDGGISFILVGAGLFHTCAINRNLFVECWGNNQFGQAPAVRFAGF